MNAKKHPILTALAATVLAVTAACAAAPPAPYFNGFEQDIDSWVTPARVASGTNGIVSAAGDWHAQLSPAGNTAFTRWGGYSNSFPTGGYSTSVDIYLNVDGGFANDRRFDWSSAVNTPAGAHRRDFVFNAGYYNDSDTTGSGPRFVISASNNGTRGSSYPKNPGRSPYTVTATGWYTFEHQFYSTAGVLSVDLNLRDSNGNILKTWTLSDPADVIGGTVGGNRYGWFVANEFPVLAFDNSLRQSADSDQDGVNDEDDECPLSDLRPLVDVNGGEAGTTSINNSGVDANGCSIQDRINHCAESAGNHGAYVSCVTSLAKELFDAGVISKGQRQELITGAAKSDVGK